MDKMLLGFRDNMDFIRDIMVAILWALLISQFIVAHTVVPSSSMVPTINVGDHMIINYLPCYYSNPVAGDIIIFRQGNINMVKRVIAVGGDIVDLEDGYVYVNGERLDELDYVREFGVTYPQSLVFPYKVPEDSYFVMGDNRLNSEDSRTFSSITRSQIFATPMFKFRMEFLK
ncbi:MAG: signal peptidase I [Epulopiscium sp. Nele67-Bin001]|nr:MAG: signal peptidase I [Epulopiscium sp. Nuni2H_MBin001]OON90857.1 MAG: signal peptidase I [Epulopiscium sp. Nele67-Bin001]